MILKIPFTFLLCNHSLFFTLSKILVKTISATKQMKGIPILSGLVLSSICCQRSSQSKTQYLHSSKSLAQLKYG